MNSCSFHSLHTHAHVHDGELMLDVCPSGFVDTHVLPGSVYGEGRGTVALRCSKHTQQQVLVSKYPSPWKEPGLPWRNRVEKWLLGQLSPERPVGIESEEVRGAGA